MSLSLCCWFSLYSSSNTQLPKTGTVQNLLMPCTNFFHAQYTYQHLVDKLGSLWAPEMFQITIDFLKRTWASKVLEKYTSKRTFDAQVLFKISIVFFVFHQMLISIPGMKRFCKDPVSGGCVGRLKFSTTHYYFILPIIKRWYSSHTPVLWYSDGCIILEYHWEGWIILEYDSSITF